MRLEAAVISDIFKVVIGQGNFYFIRKSRRILKSPWVVQYAGRLTLGIAS